MFYAVDTLLIKFSINFYTQGFLKVDLHGEFTANLSSKLKIIVLSRLGWNPIPIRSELVKALGWIAGIGRSLLDHIAP